MSVIRFARRRPAVTFAVVLALCFVVTHVPPFLPRDEDEAPGPLIGPDKVVHFAGFAALAFLLWRALPAGASVGWRVAIVVIVLATYGVVDEVTQPPFGRTADPLDWVADMLGVAVGVGIALVASRRRGGAG